MSTSFIAFAVCGFVAVVLGIEALLSLAGGAKRGKKAKRFADRLQALSAGGHAEERTVTILKERVLAESPMLMRWLARLPRVHALDRVLQQSGKTWPVSRFLAYSLGCAFTALVFGMLFHLPSVSLPFIVPCAAFLPWMSVRRARSKRIEKMERQLPDGADLIARALRAGHAFPAALSMAGQELPAPLGTEFALVFDEINFGVSMNDAMLNMVARVPVDDLRYFVIAVLIQREAGGNLAEILGNISSIIRARLKLQGQVRVLSAEGRLSAWILGGLPFAIIGLLSVINPTYIQMFWRDPAGINMAGIALAMMSFGILWMRKIIRLRA